MKGMVATLLFSATAFCKQTVVYCEAGHSAGWPANHGIWSWGNEIVVGFEVGRLRHKSGPERAIDYSRPESHYLARSLNEEQTWIIEHSASLQPLEGSRMAGVPAAPGGQTALDCPSGIRFADSNFGMTVRMGNINVGPSRFYYTYDAGKTWDEPFKLPNFGQKGVAARTDYMVNEPSDCSLFLTAAKSNGKEGRVFSARTRDGGRNWNFVSLTTYGEGT